MPLSRFEVEDLFLEQRISDVHAVPARDVAACAVKNVRRDEDDYRSAIWLFPLDGGTPRQLTAGTGQDTRPRWSADGRHVAFLSDRADGKPQIHLIEPDGGEARQLSRFKGGAVSHEWRPDGRRLLATAPIEVDPEARGEPAGEPPPRDPDAPELVWRLPYKSDGTGYLLNQQMHLFTLDADTGDCRQLTEGAFDVRQAAWSPDGRRIVYCRTREARAAHCTDLWIVDADGSHARRVTHEQPNTATPQWSPDGRWIAFSGNLDEGDAQMRLWLLDVNSGRVQPLGDEGIEVEPGSNLYWSTDSCAVLLLVTQRGVQQLVRVSVPDGGLQTLVGGQRQLGGIAVAASKLVYVAEDGQTPQELHASEPDDSGERRISEINAWWQQREPLTLELRRFDVPDGRGGTEQIEAWLLCARDAQWPMPLLLDVHGGPASHVELSFQSNVYWPVLCSRGWAVLAPNVVGSSSYGREFAERLRGHWGEMDLAQHLAIIESLQREGFTDERVAITGSSYGGYMAAWAIGNCKLFRAAVVCSPVTNLETHYGTSDSGYYSDPYAMCGSPHIDRDTSQRLSPMKHVEHACTPTLILQGKDDQRCPVNQAEELFVGLMRATDVPCEMVLYPGGDHHVLTDGKPSHRLDGITRLVEWLQRWIDRPLEQDGRSPDGQRSDGA